MNRVKSVRYRESGSWALFDVDTRERYAAPNGPRYRKRAEVIRPQVERLLEAATIANAKVIATTCANTSCIPMGGTFQAGSLWVSQEPDVLDWKKKLLHNQLILLEKRTCGSVQANTEMRAWEVFNRNPHAKDVIVSLNIPNWIVYGHSVESCVASTVRGIMALGFDVTIIRDAVVSFNGKVEDSNDTLACLGDEGAFLSTTDEFLSSI